MEVYISSIMILVATIVAWTGYQQYKLSKEVFKLNLFEKRFLVYKGVQEFLTIILQNAKIDIAQLYDFRRKTQDATFLFGDDIPKYIKIIDEKALKMWACANEYKDLPVGKERSRLVKKESELLKDLIEELPKLQEVFSPYLKFIEWK